MDFKPSLLVFSFLSLLCSLSSDHPGTRLLIVLVSCCSLKHESLHYKGHSCQARGLEGRLTKSLVFLQKPFTP